MSDNNNNETATEELKKVCCPECSEDLTDHPDVRKLLADARSEGREEGKDEDCDCNDEVDDDDGPFAKMHLFKIVGNRIEYDGQHFATIHPRRVIPSRFVEAMRILDDGFARR